MSGYSPAYYGGVSLGGSIYGGAYLGGRRAVHHKRESPLKAEKKVLEAMVKHKSKAQLVRALPEKDVVEAASKKKLEKKVVQRAMHHRR